MIDDEEVRLGRVVFRNWKEGFVMGVLFLAMGVAMSVLWFAVLAIVGIPIAIGGILIMLYFYGSRY